MGRPADGTTAKCVWSLEHRDTSLSLCVFKLQSRVPAALEVFSC